MSYDISLNDPITGRPLELENPHSISGGTYAIWGTRELWLNVTYNYSAHFRSAFQDEAGIRCLYGKTGAESIPMLKEAIGRLSDEDIEFEGAFERAKQQLEVLERVDKHEKYEVAIVLLDTMELRGVKTYEDFKGYLKFAKAPDRRVPPEKRPHLEAAIEELERLILPNYWHASEKNAKYALHGLLAFAQLRPDGVWGGD